MTAAVDATLSSLADPFKAIVKDVLEEENASVQYDLLETKLRSQLLETCSALWSNSKDDSSDAAAAAAHVTNLQKSFLACAQVCQILSDQKDKEVPGVAKLALVLLEDIVESAPLHILQLFYTETKPLSILCDELWKKSKSTAHILQFIRVCNLLLKRLPQKSEWTGRILLELAHRLPLTDRSSLKPWGSTSGTDIEYHNTGADTYEGEDDYTFYQTFWSLQHDFANPYQVSFGTFVAKFQKVLTELEAYSKSPAKAAATAGNTDTTAESAKSLHYLTNSRLLTAQLVDSASTATSSDKSLLGIHILTQFAITQAFLSTQSSQLQAALEPLVKRSQLLLAKMNPHHAAHLSKLLQDREWMWRNWKKSKCQPAMMLMPKAAATNDKVPPAIISPPAPSQELSFLQPISMKELAQISSVDMKAVVPSVETLLEDYMEALDPEAGIEEEYSPKRDKLLGWRALRLLSQTHVATHFCHMLPKGDYENLVRHVFVKKGIPGDFLPIPEEDNDDDDVEDVEEEEKVAMATDDDDDEENVKSEDKMEVNGDGKTESNEEDEGKSDAQDAKEEDVNMEGNSKKTKETTVEKAEDKSAVENKADDDDEDEDGELEEEGEEMGETSAEKEKRDAGMSDFDRAAAEEKDETKKVDTDEKAKEKIGDRNKQNQADSESTKEKRDTEEKPAQQQTDKPKQEDAKQKIDGSKPKQQQQQQQQQQQARRGNRNENNSNRAGDRNQPEHPNDRNQQQGKRKRGSEDSDERRVGGPGPRGGGGPRSNDGPRGGGRGGGRGPPTPNMRGSPVMHAGGGPPRGPPQSLQHGNDGRGPRGGGGGRGPTPPQQGGNNRRGPPPQQQGGERGPPLHQQNDGDGRRGPPPQQHKGGGRGAGGGWDERRGGGGGRGGGDARDSRRDDKRGGQQHRGPRDNSYNRRRA